MTDQDRIRNGLSRRTAIKLGIGGLLISGAGVSLARLRGADWAHLIRADETPVALSPRHFAIVGALVEVFCPRNEPFPDGRMIGVAQRIDEEVWCMPNHLQRDLRHGLDLLEFAPPTVGVFHRLTQLPLDRRTDVVRRYDRHRLLAVRQATTAVRQLAVMFYYNHPTVWAAIDYPGPFVPASPPATSQAYRQELERKRRAA